MAQVLSLGDFVDFLGRTFAVDQYPVNEQGGIYRSSTRPVQRLGLALEPWSGLRAWVAEHSFDALWLHRPWHLDPAGLPGDIGVLYHHLPFDETLTIGYNARLAGQLKAVGSLEPLGFKQAMTETGERLPQRPIGMLMDVAEQEFEACLQTVKTLFGGYDRAEAGWQSGGSRVAVVGAMNEPLIKEAAGRGANVYVTGQYRQSAQEAVKETGMAVIAVGHRRSEEWGLRALAEIVRERWPELRVAVGG